MATALREATTDAGIENTRELAGVGVGSPGAIDEKAGTVSGALDRAVNTAHHLVEGVRR